jgi:uncharacterized protein YbjT (DUF2867 family)
MAEKKVIAVVGATGAQGGGVVRAIVADKDSGFTARAITRNVNSDKAKALAASGAEVVAANVDDEASLRRAFEGAYGAFCVTFFWDHLSVEREQAEAAAMARAAKAAGVQHVIWSTLDDTRRFIPLDDPRMPTLHGKYKVPHFDGKGEADQYFRDAGVPTTFLLTVFYWDNFIYFGAGPKAGPDGTLALTMPMGDKKLPSMAAEDIGKCAYGVFKRPDLIGQTVGIAGGHLTGEEMAAGMSKALGVPVRYNDVPADVYRSFGFPGADDMGNMFQFKRDFNDYYCKSRSIEFARSLNPELQSYEQWLAANAKAIPLG